MILDYYRTIIWCLSVFLLSAIVNAEPEQLEVWYLHLPKNNSNSFMNHEHSLKGTLIAQYERPRQCQRMGDYCFDPQIGLYAPTKINTGNQKKSDLSEAEINGIDASLGTLDAVNRDYIDCKEKEKFDIFCGRAKKNRKKRASFSLWIDTSSSMREFDAEDKNGECYRLSLVRRLKQNCDDHLEVKTFDTSKKQLGDWKGLCMNHGLNNEKRLIKWIKNFKGKRLIVVTDIYELSKRFVDYASSIGATFKGAEALSTFKAEDMVQETERLQKYCRTKGNKS